MRLTSIRVENLRAIHHAVELSGLTSFEVLHGDNNSGKSSLLLGAALGLHLLGREEVWQAEPNPVLNTSVRLDLPPRFNKLKRNRNAGLEPIRIRLGFEGGDVAGAAFEVEPAKAAWLVDGWWWPPGKEGQHRREPPMVRPSWAFVDAERRGPSVDDETDPTTWDIKLIRAARVAEDAGARRRLKAVERALTVFAPELGPGTLEPVGSEDKKDLELAWVNPDTGVAQPFSDEGTGLRVVKDILVATEGGTAQIVLIEEPEVHLSASALARLKALLEGLSSKGRQVILSSHVYGFDGLKVWRLSRTGGEVKAARDVGAVPPVVEGGAPDVEKVEAEQRRLRRLWVSAGQPHVGFVSQDGLTQLPRTLLNELKAPTNVTWARVKEGVYGMVTLAALEAEPDEIEGGNP